MARVWMVVSSGYHDDIRVRKMAASAMQLPEIEEVHVIAMRSASVESPPDGQGAHYEDVRVHHFPEWRSAGVRAVQKPLRRAAFILWASRLIRRQASDGDILHAHDLDTAPVSLLLPRRPILIRRVLDLHECYSGTAGLRPLSRWVLRRMERLLLPRFDGVIFVSSAAQEAYGRRCDLPPSVVVTNSRHEGEIRVRSLRQPTGRLVYLGRFTRDRGLEALIEAVDHLRGGVLLDLIGFGPRRNHLMSLADAPSRAGRVRVLPPVALDDVTDCLVHYDIGFALTELTCDNHRLTVSNKLFEYAAAGLPVVMSPAVEHKRLQHDYALGVVVPVRPDCIARAVRDLLTDSVRYDNARTAAIRLARCRSWDKEVRSLPQMYGLAHD
jgi:glycosyltransferase involved in cell wall biosynthesis